MHAGHHVLSHPRYIPWYLLSIMWLNPYNYDIPILYPGYILTKFPWNIMKHHETSPFTGWWFGISLFSTIYGIILSHWRTHIFQDGYIAPPTSDNPMVFLGHFMVTFSVKNSRRSPHPPSAAFAAPGPGSCAAPPHRRRSAWRRQKRRRTRRQGGSTRRRGAKNSRDPWEATCWDLETLGNLGEIGREIKVFRCFSWITRKT